TGAHNAELARIIGIASRLEPNLEVIDGSATNGDRQAALAIEKETLPGNIHLRNGDRISRDIENRDFGERGLADLHGTEAYRPRGNAKSARRCGLRRNG